MNTYLKFVGVFLVVCGLVLFGLIVWPGPRVRAAKAAETAALEAQAAVEAPAVVAEAPALIVQAEEPDLETVEVAEAPEPELFTELTSTEVYSYTPGGESFGAWATDVVTPDGATQPCGRVWQATNLENLPWTAVLCDWKVSEIAPKLQWPHATQLTVSGDGIVSFELWRDLAASQEVTPDPYGVANAGNSPLGLGWFIQGFNGTVCVNDECQTLEGGGVYQVGFPSDLQGHYDIKVSVGNGQVQFWQGERLTTENNWPLPAAD